MKYPSPKKTFQSEITECGSINPIFFLFISIENIGLYCLFNLWQAIIIDLQHVLAQQKLVKTAITCYKYKVKG